MVGVDGSIAALAALRWAVREAGLRAGALHAVRAWEDLAKRVAPYASHAMFLSRAGDLRSARDQLQSVVNTALGPAPLIPVKVTVAEGLAARVLLDHAAGADLLVLGSAPHRAPDGAGPVARACLRHAPCPVVVVSAAMSDLPERPDLPVPA